ncbi:hypothetical protein TH63_16215 [Rufibacter radiotolerans]|jgi:hypothetical protein|uniref:Uncharacterized protein n=1 Tax=Rufibacter radiotolerans TaxID=1379910 RepID=A0A0H4W8Q3_9BACT|nr:hypothetical protein [Rufibacter radiotolerans]AKQ46821.1 hypothetical protein TH63_16215 [Rufibacter radiotolerans]
MNNRNVTANMLLNGMLVISFLILMYNLEHPNILVPLLSFIGFITFVGFKIVLVLRHRKSNPSK